MGGGRESEEEGPQVGTLSFFSTVFGNSTLSQNYHSPFNKGKKDLQVSRLIFLI